MTCALAPPAVLRDDVEVPVLELDLGIEGLDADGGGHLAVAQHVQGLDQAGHAGSGFQVAQVALDRTDGQRRVLAALLGQGQADGAGFDRIADRGAGAVRFQVVDLGGRDAGLFVDLAHQRGLGLHAGHGEAGLAAVGVDGAAGHHGQDGVAVGDRLVVVLQHEDAAAFGTDVAVAGGVEDVAAPARRQHGRLGEGDEAVGVQVQADAAGQRLGAFARQDGAACLVEGDQRGRAGRVHGDAGAAQVEEVGEAVGGDAGGVAGRHRGVDGVQVFGQPVGVVGAGDADIHAAVRTAQGGGRDAGVFQGFPAHFQQQALLRVHQRGFARRDAEEPCVEPGDVADGAGGKGVGGAGMVFGGMQVGVGGPAVLFDVGDQVAAFQQGRPVAVMGGAGKPKRKSNDGNALTHAESFWPRHAAGDGK